MNCNDRVGPGIDEDEGLVRLSPPMHVLTQARTDQLNTDAVAFRSQVFNALQKLPSRWNTHRSDCDAELFVVELAIAICMG